MFFQDINLFKLIIIIAISLVHSGFALSNVIIVNITNLVKLLIKWKFGTKNKKYIKKTSKFSFINQFSFCFYNSFIILM